MTNYVVRHQGNTINTSRVDSDSIISSGHIFSNRDTMEDLRQRFLTIPSCILHLDAGDLTSLTTQSSGDVQLVTQWRNRDGLTGFATEASGQFANSLPWHRESPRLGCHEVYFPGHGQALSLGEQLDTRILGAGKPITVFAAVSFYSHTNRPSTSYVEILSKMSKGYSVDLSFALYAAIFFENTRGKRVAFYWDAIQDGTYDKFAETILDCNGEPFSTILVAVINPTLSTSAYSTLYNMGQNFTDDGAGTISSNYMWGTLNSFTKDTSCPLVIGPWSMPNPIQWGLHDLAIFGRVLSNQEILSVSSYMGLKNRMKNKTERDFMTMPVVLRDGSVF